MSDPNSTNDDPGEPLRLKVLLAGITLLFILMLIIIGVLVATRQRTPVTKDATSLIDIERTHVTKCASG